MADSGSPVAAPVAAVPSSGEPARRWCWALIVVCVLAQMAYPLVSGAHRDVLTVVTVALCCLAAVVHAALTRGRVFAARMFAVTAGGGLLVEAIGTATGFPFGAYHYTDSLGARVWGVPVVIPLAWTMMAWPAWLVAARLVAGRTVRVALGGWALASWDLFLDPQMVAAGHWVWHSPAPALPFLPSVPVSNYAGWLAVALALAAAISRLPGSAETPVSDAPMYAVYLWTYFSSVLAHLAFFGLPGSALWGGAAMGTAAIPLALALRGRGSR